MRPRPGKLDRFCGASGHYAIAISPVNEFAANVALSCSGALQLSACVVSPGSVAVNSAGASANVVVTTTGVSAGLAHPTGFPPSRSNRLALWLAMSGAFVLGFLGSRVRRSSCVRRRPRFYGLTALCLLSIGSTVSACGGSSSSSKSRWDAVRYLQSDDHGNSNVRLGNIDQLYKALLVVQ